MIALAHVVTALDLGCANAIQEETTIVKDFLLNQTTAIYKDVPQV